MEAFREILPGDAEYVEEWLDVNFPQHRHSCDYPSSCDFIDVCHSPGYADDPVRTGMYTYREGHHDVEKAALKNVLVQIKDMK